MPLSPPRGFIQSRFWKGDHKGLYHGYCLNQNFRCSENIFVFFLTELCNKEGLLNTLCLLICDSISSFTIARWGSCKQGCVFWLLGYCLKQNPGQSCNFWWLFEMLTDINIPDFAVAFAQKDTFIPVVKANGDHFTQFVRFVDFCASRSICKAQES